MLFLKTSSTGLLLKCLVCLSLINMGNAFSAEKRHNIDAKFMAKKERKVIVLPDLAKDKKETYDVIINGLVLDRTITRYGKEFVRQFNLSWQDIPNTTGINVIIKEKKLPRSGTRLSIELNGQITYQANFSMRQNQIKVLVDQAMYYTINGISRLNLDTSGPDLADSGY
jgi:curli production assembly/transport component CsgE